MGKKKGGGKVDGGGGDKKKDAQGRELLQQLAFVVEKQANRTKSAQRQETLEELWQDLNDMAKPLDKLLAHQKKLKLKMNDPSEQSDLETRKQKFVMFTDWFKKEAPGSLVGDTCGFDVGIEEGVGVTASRVCQLFACFFSIGGQCLVFCAFQDLRNGETFMKVPRKLMITEESMRSSKVLPFFWNPWSWWETTVCPLSADVGSV